MSKVFIGLPAYNGSRFVREAINSIRNQSYTDWRMLISDDTSTDDTGIIAQEYAKLDPRITYYRQEKNLGLFANFKFVLDQADTDYFLWMAQDDLREKDYLKACVEQLERNSKFGLATTQLVAIDSLGRNLIAEPELVKFSERSILTNVARYILQPEALGKCNLMYGLFRTKVARETWQAYPQRMTWGQDYLFSLALIARHRVYVNEKILFKKRLGGFSSPNALIDDTKDQIRKIEYKNPKNHMVPFKRFKGYYNGHTEALRGTPYRLLGASLLLLRLPRAFLIYLTERNFKKVFTKKI